MVQRILSLIQRAYSSIKIKYDESGVSIVEIIIATSIFSLYVVSFIGAINYFNKWKFELGDKEGAIYLSEEGIEASRSIRDVSFDNLIAGIHGLSIENNQWVLSGENDLIDKYTRTIEIVDESSDVKNIISTVSWVNRLGYSKSVSLVAVLTNWLEQALFAWLDDLFSEFDLGSKNSVVIENIIEDGEVRLAYQDDFLNSEVYTTFDIPGSADAYDLVLVDNYLFVASVNNPSDEEVLVFDTSDIGSGNLNNLIGSYELGGSAYSIAISGNYAYLATDIANQELVVLNISDPTNIQLAGVFDADVGETRPAIAVQVLDSTVYLGTQNNSGTGDNEFYVLDASDPSAIFLIESVEIDDQINDIVIDGNYAYLATAHNDQELVVIDLENLSTTPIQAVFDSDEGKNGYSVAVKDNMAYLGTQNNSGGSDREFYPLDISDIDNGNIFANSADEVEITGDVMNITIYGNYAYLATNKSGIEEMTIVNLEDNSVYSVIDLAGQSTAYSSLFFGKYLFVVTSDNSNEIQIVQGGQLGDQYIYVDSMENSWSESNSGTDETVASNDIAIDDYSYRANFSNSSSYVRFNNTFDTTGFGSMTFNVNSISPWAFALYGNDWNGAGDYGSQVTVNNNIYPNLENNTDNIIDFPSLDLAEMKTNASVVVIEKNSSYTMPVSELSANDGKIIYVRFRNRDSSQNRTLTLDFSANSNGSFNNSIVTNGSIQLRYYNGATITSASSTFPVIAAKRLVRFRQNADMTVNGIVFSDDSELRTTDLSGGNRITINGSVICETIDSSMEYVDIVYNQDYHFNSPMYFYPKYYGQNIEISSNFGNSVNLTDYIQNGIDNDLNTWQEVNIPLADLSIGSTTISYFQFSAPDSNENNLNTWYIDNVYLSAMSIPSNYVLEGIFTSREHDTELSGSVIDSINWNQSGEGSVKFQIRTAPDLAGNPGIWSTWLGPSGINDFYTDREGADIINSIHSDGSDDQWIQYRAFLNSGGTTTPVLEDVTIYY